MTQKQKTKNYFASEQSANRMAARNKKHIFSLDLINKLIAFLLIICGAGYLISVNSISIQGIVLQEKKKQAAELTEANNSIELKIMELESSENISRRAEELKMVKVDKIDYIAAAEETIAKK